MKEAHQTHQYSTKSQNHHPARSQSSLYMPQFHHPGQTSSAQHEQRGDQILDAPRNITPRNLIEVVKQIGSDNL